MIRYRDIPPEMPIRRHSRDMAMSLFSRKKPEDAVRDYDSWDPALRAAPETVPAAAEGEDVVVAKSGRSRTGEEHLKAATDALEAKARRDA